MKTKTLAFIFCIVGTTHIHALDSYTALRHLKTAVVSGSAGALAGEFARNWYTISQKEIKPPMEFVMPVPVAFCLWCIVMHTLRNS